MIIPAIILLIMGLYYFVNTVFRWDSYFYQFPLEYYLRDYSKRKYNKIKNVYEEDGEKGLRKYFMLWSFFLLAVGIGFIALGTKDLRERVQIQDFPQAWEGDTVSFAGGELMLERIGFSDGFMATRFNLDKNRYEEVEVKADMYKNEMLLVMTTLTNNTGDTLSIVHEDFNFYAKKPEEGSNIQGYSAVDGYLYHDNAIELAAGESIPVWFWMNFTEEELEQSVMLVLQYGNTGCLLVPSS